MKYVAAALTVLALPTAACAQTPEPPATADIPATPEITTNTEACGENCTRTTTVIRTSELDEDGNEIISKNVKVIELTAGGEELADIDVDIEGDASVRKEVKIIAATDGELTPEMQAKIDALVADIDGGEGYAFKHSGDGLVVLSSDSDVKKMKVIIRDGDEEIIGDSGNVTIDQSENADGSRTIRISPQDGSDETMVITIQKEKSSKSDN